MSKPPVEVWVGVVKAITTDGLVDVELDTGDVLEAVDPVGSGFTVGDAVVVLGHDYTAHALAATPAVRAGRVSISLSNAASGSKTVTWDAMPGTLSVVTTVYGTVAYIATVENLSSSGCSIRLQHINSTAATINLSVHYIVVSA